MGIGRALKDVVLSTEVKVALIAFSAAIIGSAVGGGFTVWASNNQTSAETEKSRAEFLRSQQQTTYADFINEANQVRVAEEDYTAKLETAVGTFSDDQIEQSYQATQTAYDKFLVSFATVAIVGSTEASAAAYSVGQSLATGNDAVRLIKIHRHYGAPERPTWDAYREASSKLYHELDVFVTAARADIQK